LEQGSSFAGELER